MKKLIVPLILGGLIAAPAAGRADLMGKPHFEVFFDDSVGADAEVELFTCQEAGCGDAEPFKEFGPQRFECSVREGGKNLSCFAMAYGFSPFLKLRVTVGGARYDSSPFEPGKDIDAGLKEGKLTLTPRGFWKGLFSR